MKASKEKELIVVKYGSNCVVNSHRVSTKRINGFVDRLAEINDRYDLAIVTSGAVAAGNRVGYDTPFDRLSKRVIADSVNEADMDESQRRMVIRRYLQGGEFRRQTNVLDDQVLAAMGSASISEAWRKSFARLGMFSGQVLVTHSEMQSQEGQNLASTYAKLKQAGVIPVINQNDALARQGDKNNELEKIKRGEDNDWLALDVAKLLGAKALVLCTGDVEGVLVDGEVRSRIQVADIPSLEPHLSEAETDYGKGGMKSKLRAAGEWASYAAGNLAYICNADADYRRMLLNYPIGTQVVQ